MAGVTSSLGIGSGMDINGIVSQLVKAEGQPQFAAISRQETATQTRLSALGSLKSALSTFQTAVKKLKDGNLFKTNQAVSANTAIFTATAGAGSVPGTHSVEVTQLAKAQNSITNAEYINSSSVVTATGGTLNFTYGPGSTKTPFAVTIGTNATLANIRDAINGAAGNKGVTASIVNVDSTVTPGTTISKLVLTSKDTGVANGFNLAVTGGDAGLNALDTITLPANYTTTASADAVIKVDGLAATRSTNTITDVLSGVTLNLQSAVPGTAVNLNLTLDNAAINKTITDFVTAYNNFHTATKDLSKYSGTTDGANGPLLGDSLLRNMTSKLRQDASNTVTSVTSDYNSLAMIGIKIDGYGVMSLDSTKLNTALAANLSAVSDVFSSANGVAVRLDTDLTQYLQSGASLDTQQSTLNKTLKSLASKRESVQLRLDNLQKSMQKQFIAMDIAVGQFQSTAQMLTQKFAK